MDAQMTNRQDSAAMGAGRIGAHDVAYVSLALLALLFGNIFIVRAIDIALDAWMR